MQSDEVDIESAEEFLGRIGVDFEMSLQMTLGRALDMGTSMSAEDKIALDRSYRTSTRASRAAALRPHPVRAPPPTCRAKPASMPASPVMSCRASPRGSPTFLASPPVSYADSRPSSPQVAGACSMSQPPSTINSPRASPRAAASQRAVSQGGRVRTGDAEAADLASPFVPTSPGSETADASARDAGYGRRRSSWIESDRPSSGLDATPAEERPPPSEAGANSAAPDLKAWRPPPSSPALSKRAGATDRQYTAIVGARVGAVDYWLAAALSMSCDGGGGAEGENMVVGGQPVRQSHPAARPTATETPPGGEAPLAGHAAAVVSRPSLRQMSTPQFEVPPLPSSWKKHT